MYKVTAIFKASVNFGRWREIGTAELGWASLRWFVDNPLILAALHRPLRQSHRILSLTIQSPSGILVDESIHLIISADNKKRASGTHGEICSPFDLVTPPHPKGALQVEDQLISPEKHESSTPFHCIAETPSIFQRPQLLNGGLP